MTDVGKIGNVIYTDGVKFYNSNQLTDEQIASGVFDVVDGDDEGFDVFVRNSDFSDTTKYAQYYDQVNKTICYVDKNGKAYYPDGKPKRALAYVSGAWQDATPEPITSETVAPNTNGSSAGDSVTGTNEIDNQEVNDDKKNTERSEFKNSVDSLKEYADIIKELSGVDISSVYNYGENGTNTGRGQHERSYDKYPFNGGVVTIYHNQDKNDINYIEITTEDGEKYELKLDDIKNSLVLGETTSDIKPESNSPESTSKYSDVDIETNLNTLLVQINNTGNGNKDELMNFVNMQDQELITKMCELYAEKNNNASLADLIMDKCFNNDGTHNTNKFDHYPEQIELAQKLYSDSTSSCSAEDKKTAEDLAQKYVNIVAIGNGTWCDNNKESFIEDMNSMTPEQIKVFQAYFDNAMKNSAVNKAIPSNPLSEGNPWYSSPTVSMNDFSFDLLVQNYLNRNWNGAFKYNNQNLDVIKKLAQSGAI